MRGSPASRMLFVIAVVVVLAGCTGFLPGESTEPEISGTVGEVENVSYDDELDIDPEDGFTEAELEQLTKRTMARIEVVRNLEYDRPVDVEVFTREEYADWREGRTGSSETQRMWENQYWRSLFIIGADRDATTVLDETFAESVQGFYRPGSNEIVVVSDSETPTIDKATLVHELVHALQDQQFGLEFGQPTRDERTAYDTLVEGEADHITGLYLQEWCGEQWSCIRPELSTEANDSSRVVDRDVMLVLLQPYRQGVEFIDRIESDDGWERVDELHESPPRNTAATIYPERPLDASPQEITVPDRSGEEWHRFDHEPPTDTFGAGSLYAMFAANGVIENEEGYAHPAVEGWDGDRFVPYRNGEQVGYVWELAWETDADAEEFAAAYRDLLDSQDARARGQASYVVSDGPFGGAYRVTVESDRVRIVNAPDLETLDDVHG